MPNYLENADAACKTADFYLPLIGSREFSGGLEYSLVRAGARAAFGVLALGLALQWYKQPEFLTNLAKGPLFEGHSFSNWAIAGGVVGTLGTGTAHLINRRNVAVDQGDRLRPNATKTTAFKDYGVGQTKTFSERASAAFFAVLTAGTVVTLVNALYLGAHIGLLRYTGKLETLSKAFGLLTGVGLAHVGIQTLACTSTFYDAKAKEKAAHVVNPPRDL